MIDPEKMGRIVRTFFPFFVACGLVCGIIITIWIFKTFPIGLENRSEQSAQVEVVGKKILKHSSRGGRSRGRTSYNYIVTFKFPDGSVKEFKVDRVLKIGYPNKDPYSSTYDSIHEGDTGILTYKEIENIEEKYKNEAIRYDGRLFIRFDKTSTGLGN